MAKYYEENSNDVNRCRRCNRPLSDPSDKYGWWCAKLLGYGDHQNDSHELDYDNLNVYNEDISTNLEASSSDSKLFSNTANISSNIYYQMGVDNYYFINDVQKNIQREFWKAGAQKYLREDGKWIINAKLDDIYDFTEIMSFMDGEGGLSKQASLGTIANDAAVISQKLGAIKPYKVTVDFWTTR